MEAPDFDKSVAETWQVDVNGQVYDASFEELVQWIDEGAVLRGDMVRRGNLRWLEAAKIPKLIPFFNAKDAGDSMPVVVTTTDAGAGAQTATPQENYQSFENSLQNHTDEPQTSSALPDQHSNAGVQAGAVSSGYCIMHPGSASGYVCSSCSSEFCKSCPKSYGGSVWVCPMCGAMCKPIADLQKQHTRASQYNADISQGFGFADFSTAMSYPFRFRTSLIAGAFFFMVFSIGQLAAGVGGIFMMTASIFCFMLANMLTFGALSNTVENFAQGETEQDFMPSFENFSIMDNVLHPFVLYLGVIISSFGPFIVIVVAMFFYVINSLGGLAAPGNDPQQIKAMMENANTAARMADGAADRHIQDIDQATNPVLTPGQRNAAAEEEEFRQLNDMINETRKQQLETSIGKTPESEAAQLRDMVSRMLKVAVPFVLVALVALAWGLFYFPAACTVAGYTQSFASAINPFVGLDTIKRLGFDYVKILFFSFLLVMMAGFIGGVISTLLSAFDMPRVGNIPANALTSLFTFYFWMVFSVTLGLALYKNSAKLNLYRG